jgi:hypothetical protein
MNFLERAQYTTSRGVPVIRVRSNSKAAMDNDWPRLATTNTEILKKWNDETPTANCAAVAKAEIGGFWFLELDVADEVIERIRKETGKEIPETFRVRSRQNRGHFYWKHNPASIALGNLSQTYVKHGDFSVRSDNQYVVSAGSIHPHSQQPYVALRDEPIIECPDWLIAWLLSQKLDVKANQAPEAELKKDAHGLIEHGQIHGYMLREAGRLRHLGLSQHAIEVALLELVHKNCAPPIDETRVKTMALSICNFPPGQSGEILFTTPTQSPNIVGVTEPEELPKFDEPYPKFPHYVMEGTSIYEKFVKPICDQNSRIDYFMWIPAMQLLLNYVGPKIKIKGFGGARPFRGAVYSVIIGKKGTTNKSSSVNDAMMYFNYCGLLAHASRDTKSAEGRILSWSAGSPEGLGIDMQRTGCKNAVLYYDELSKLVAKAGIDSSAMASDLLTMYEAGKFANDVKSTKERYALEPETYCTSLIACTTDKKFAELWSRLAGSDTGLDDRFFFVLQPETLPESRLQQFVNTVNGSIETKRLIDKAIQQAEYEYDDPKHPGLMRLNAQENRLSNRAEKWALAIAIDMGLTSVDDECISRGVHIVEYEMAVKNYLRVYEAVTREGQIQGSIRRTLAMNKGRMEARELERRANPGKYGTTLWSQAYKGLVNNGIIRLEGKGVKGDPMFVQLLQKRDVFDE